MVDPYKMVYINVLASLALLFGILFYRFVYPKRKINLFFLLILISFLPVMSIFRKGVYESGDFNIHIYRIMSFYDSLREGHLMPSWAAELNATYGNPLFIFNYSLSYYMISFFHFIGFSFIASMKIFLGLTFLSSGIFMYLWIKTLTDNHLAAFSSSVFYLFNPYHLIDFHFRATPGESSIFALAPLVLFFITAYSRKRRFHFLILTSLFTILLFLGHPLLSVVILGIIILFTILVSLDNNDIISLFLSISSLLIGIAASMYSWISFLLYAPYTFHNPSSEVSFNPFSQLFYSPWRLGFLFQGHQGELALIIGYTQLFVVFASVFILLKYKILVKIKKYYLFWISIFFLFLFLMSPLSKIIWQFFPIFWMLIPFGRLLLPTAICTSVIAGYFIIFFSNSRRKRKFIYILLVITIASTILNWGHRRVIPKIGDDVLQRNVWKSTMVEGQTAYFLNNKWADPNNFWFSELPKQRLEIIQGKAIVKELKRTSVKHLYVINADTPITIRENTLYFPGWSLKSNGNNIDIYPGKRGVINAGLPQGLQYIELTYDDLLMYKLSKIMSVGIFFSLLLTLIINRVLWTFCFFTRKP